MRIRTIILLILATMLVAACGDDDAASTTAPTTGQTTGDPDLSGVNFDGFTNEECLRIAVAWSQAASLGFVGGTEGATEALEDLAEGVPPEVAADFALYAQALAEYSTALVDAGIDISNPATFSSPQAQAAMTAAAEAFQDAGLVEASENISAFLEVQCADG
jgi:hypothetical protein